MSGGKKKKKKEVYITHLYLKMLTCVRLEMSAAIRTVAKRIKKQKENQSKAEYRSEGLTLLCIALKDQRIYSEATQLFPPILLLRQ